APGAPAATVAGRGAVAGAAAPVNPEAAHLFPRNLKANYPVAARAEGVWIEDTAGRRYLDACSGAVVCSIGHGVKEVAEVMTAQARRLAFTHSSQFITRETMELTARIAALAPGDMKKTGRVYLVSGGSEAVETAIKMARQYHVESGRPSKHKVVTRWQSYHGSTLGALAATGNVARRAIYTPLIAATPHIAPCYCYRCPYDLKFPSCEIACVDDLERTLRQEGPDTVAAFMAEPIVGATLGAAPAVDGYWQRARALCDKYNVLLIADEVMTGVGRTGKNFAVDHWKVVPDLIVTGKGLSAGYTPLGAVIARGFVADAIAAGRGYFEHGFTYSANPLSAAVGNAVLAYIERHGLIARAAKIGKILGERLAGLRRHRFVGDVRGAGMMWGVEIVKDRATKEPYPAALKVSRRIYDAAMAEGLLIYPGTGTREGQDGDHFIVAPPFTIDRGEIDELAGRLHNALGKVAAGLR
ncbi:MAG TPA: aspartate aminotransferase family protein, partial [Candidatus Polarisedimenticolia bacterium]|nr:aspartate aminotransferase family protein [Candidatus Polarisedimenticolia bacterium]